MGSYNDYNILILKDIVNPCIRHNNKRVNKYLIEYVIGSDIQE